MASSDQSPGAIPAPVENVPGEATTMSTSLLSQTTGMVQKFAPIHQITQHICTWAHYSQDPSRCIQTHHHAARINQDFVQCAVYDNDTANARLIGIEYIVSERLFEALPEEEKKLWHSHFYEIREGLWVNPGLPEMMAKPELRQLAKTYGKFWCTWQFDRGDVLPMGAPALMMSPQAERPVPPEMVKARDLKYDISTADYRARREGLEAPAKDEPLSDFWRQSDKGWVTRLEQQDVKKPEMSTGEPMLGA